MDEPIEPRACAQDAVIGIAVILIAVMLVAFGFSNLEPWSLLALGAPIGMVVSAITPLRRIGATGQPD